MKRFDYLRVYADFLEYVGIDEMIEKDCYGWVHPFMMWLAEEIEFTKVIKPSVGGGQEQITIKYTDHRVNKYIKRDTCTGNHKPMVAEINNPDHPIKSISYCMKCHEMVSWSYD